MKKRLKYALAILFALTLLVNGSFSALAATESDVLLPYREKLNLLNEEDPNLVIDDSIVKDTLWELTGSSFGIYGPYTIGDNANGVTSMPQFLFYTSVEWGCEVGNEDYCDQMTKASNDLEEKNLLGIWIYDSIDKDRRFLTEF